MRTGKVGLDYFPFDVDFFEDEKVEFVSAKYDILGENVCIKLLCRIYRNGYYLPWGEDEALLFTKRAGGQITLELVNGVVNELIKRNFFSKIHFEKHLILTSNGIQKRFLEATRRRKRIIMYQQYIIADIEGYNVDILPLNDGNGTQRKGEESKGKNKYLFVGTSNEVRLSEYLFSKILQNNPKAKPPNIQVWAKQVDLRLRIDKREPKDIYALIDWCQEDDFWKVNILSTQKLREQFDRLWMKMTSKPGSNNDDWKRRFLNGDK